MALKLRSVIDAHGLAYGDTKNGADWCIKALHPADPMTACVGVPDYSAVPSVLQHYQATFTISPAAGCTDGWSFISSVLPHPVDFMYVDVVDSINPAGLAANFLNPQLAGATHSAKYESLIAMAARWRLAYMSVSVYQDGPDLSNQGSIVVCQHAVAPRLAWHSEDFLSTQANLGSCQIHNFTEEDMPNFDTAQAMPNAYFNRSKEGVYCPLKLTETCQDWVSESDCCAHAQLTADPVNTAWMTQPVGQTYPWPHCSGGVTGLTPFSIGPGTRTGQRTSPLLSGVVAQICGRNLSAATRFSVFVRCGLEMQVFPTSILAPQMTLSPAYDARALQTYFAIARELKDAYPVDHNDLGKIWDTISDIAGMVLPVLKQVPVIGGFAQGADMIVQTGNAIRARRRKNATPAKRSGTSKTTTSDSRGNTPSLSEITRARTAPPTPPPKPARLSRPNRNK